MSEEPELMDHPLSRDQILGYAVEPFPIEAFGGTVYIKPLTGKERDKYEMQNLEQQRNGTTRLNLINARARLAIMCMVERDGNGKWQRMFHRSDLERVGQLPASELDKVTEAAREASGIGEEESEAVVDSFDEGIAELPGDSSSSDLEPASA